MIMGERHRWQGRVLLFWKEAADLEPAGRPRPCGKSSDAELVSRGREEGQHPHPFISPTGLIWGQIGGGADGNCVSTAKWSLPGAPWGCQDMWNVPCLGFIPGFPCWVISSTRQVWTAQEEREQELQVQVKPAGILHFWPVLCALDMCLVLGRS